MARTVLHEDERGFVVAEGNELTVGSKVDDPPKVRLTSPCFPTGGAGGAVSFNLSRQPGVCYGSQQTEMGMVRVEQAEDVRGDASNPKAEINFLLNNGGTADINMQKPLAFVWNAITRLLLPLGGSGGSSMRSPNGRWLVQQQDDGNLVQYDMIDPSHPIATWSSWTGPIS